MMNFNTDVGKIFDSVNFDFNSQSKDRQLELIKKYFPIGIEVFVNRDFSDENCFTGISQSGIINGYVPILNDSGDFFLYNLSVEGNNPNSYKGDRDRVHIIETAHPGFFVYTDEALITAKRDSKIDEIINENS